MSWADFRVSSIPTAYGVTSIPSILPGENPARPSMLFNSSGVWTRPCSVTLAPPGARGLGAFSSWFGVSGIPYAFVIDGEGRVAEHGKLEQVLEIARQLPARNAQAQP